jgi:hypothetical protein
MRLAHRDCDTIATDEIALVTSRIKLSLYSEILVGGPGFEPGASRSRTVLVACPRVSGRFAEVRLNSNCLSSVSVRVLREPPGAGNLCPGCAPATVNLSTRQDVSTR